MFDKKNALEAKQKQLRQKVMELNQQTLPEMQAKQIEISLDTEKEKLRRLEAKMSEQGVRVKQEAELEQLNLDVSRLEKDKNED